MIGVMNGQTVISDEAWGVGATRSWSCSASWWPVAWIPPGPGRDRVAV